jgi:type IV secretion system protein VirB1
VLLPLTVFAHMALTCAPGVAPDTLAAVAKTESGFDALAINDNNEHRSYHPQTTDDAIALGRRLIEAGHSVDLGLLQINNRNFRWLGLTVANAFDPCRSIAAGAAVLTAYSRYNTGSPTAGFANGYVERVAANSPRGLSDAIGRSDHAPPPGPGVEPHRWMAFPDPASANWQK